MECSIPSLTLDMNDDWITQNGGEGWELGADRLVRRTEWFAYRKIGEAPFYTNGFVSLRVGHFYQYRRVRLDYGTSFWDGLVL